MVWEYSIITSLACWTMSMMQAVSLEGVHIQGRERCEGQVL